MKDLRKHLADLARCLLMRAVQFPGRRRRSSGSTPRQTSRLRSGILPIAVLVLSGITSRADLKRSATKPDYVFANVGEIDFGKLP